MTRPGIIKLRAEDTDDLAVIAACLQDAIACLAEMAYEPAEKRFALVVERFRWEDAEAHPASRSAGVPAVKTGIHFEHVNAVKLRGLDQRRRTDMLELLTVTSEPAGKGVAITLVFAGGGEVRLEAERLLCRMRDLGAPHRTRLLPRHPLDEGGGP